MDSDRESSLPPSVASSARAGDPRAEPELKIERLAPIDSAAEPSASPPPDEEEPALDPADTLSPAVRRLVRQYDLDITGIHGSGPSGRIRVGDVIALLGRGDAERPTADDAVCEAAAADTAAAEPPAPAPLRASEPDRAANAAAPLATTVFECDLGRILAHRRDHGERLLASYWLVACAEALQAVPEIAGRVVPSAARFGVHLSSADGDSRPALVDAAEESPLASIGERLESFDRQLRAVSSTDLDPADLLVHYYGASGSLLATPTPLGANHAASVGIGRARRQIVLRTLDGEEAPRAAALCYVTVTFRPERVTLEGANKFLAHVVRLLETWE